MRHFVLAQLTQDRTRQYAFDEEVALENQVFALGGAKALKDAPGFLRPVIPAGQRHHDAFHVGNAPDLRGVQACPVEPQRSAPVVQHQSDRAAHPQGAPQPVQIAVSDVKAVALGSVAGRQLFGVTVTYQIRDDDAGTPDQGRNDVAPQVA